MYLDARYDASATPRVSVPPDLRGPDDGAVARCVLELPVPVIALPAAAEHEPWWLVLAAHETGHHVQHDLGLVRRTAEALEAVMPDDTADHWHDWAREAFADAYSVLMVGTAAAWAVAELEFGPPAQLARVPRDGDRYPPPCVRLALLGEIARVLGLADPGPGATEVADWLAASPFGEVPASVRVRLKRYLDTTPAAAKVLVDLPVDGVPLRELCGFDARAFGDDGRVGAWARAVATSSPVITGRADREAARLGVAGGVAAYLSAVGADAAVESVRDNLPARLAECGPTGVLAGAADLDVATIAARLAEHAIKAGRRGRN
ncbi:hypothetical protein [Saccharothrix variisporea]|uniref:hypothetical protein n=1 Tax=Saccharothrix variisporea TaxID=543527 RepID=UPI0011C37BE5|nr:hypothetical protein [Saccharothrix variisporea]